MKRARKPLSDSTRDETSPRRSPTPLRALRAVAPSGGEIRFLKWDDGTERSLSWYQGCLTALENDQFWKAKLRAERQGAPMWQAAIDVLMLTGWEVLDD
jgi:hypothetical protein